MIKYRVFLISEHSKPWHNAWYYKAGFEKNGHEVVLIEPYSTPSSIDRLFDKAKQTKPDLIIHTKKEFPAETFQKLRTITKVVQWYPDPVFPEWLPDYIRASDIFFTMSEGRIEEFRKYNPRVFFLSQGFEPSFFEMDGISEDDIKKYSADIAFVGNLGSFSQYLPRRNYINRVIEEGFTFRWWGPRLPRKFATIPLLLGRLGRSYGGKFVWGKDYAKVAKLSKIFLAFDSMPQIRKSMSARMYTAVGCGAFYMCQHVEGIEEILEPDKEIVTFRTEDEMIEKIRFYLQNDDLRRAMADAGQKRVLRDHTYKNRIKEMLAIIENET